MTDNQETGAIIQARDAMKEAIDLIGLKVESRVMPKAQTMLYDALTALNKLIDDVPEDLNKMIDHMDNTDVVEWNKNVPDNYCEVVDESAKLLADGVKGGA